MPISDEQFYEHMRKNTEALTRLETTLSETHHRLFGNGQPGIVQTLYNETQVAKATADSVHTALDLRIQELKGLRTQDRRYAGGFVSAVSIFGGAMLWYIHTILSRVSDFLTITKIGH